MGYRVQVFNPGDRDDPRARYEFVDVATGERVRPAPPDRTVPDGAAPTGRYVAELDGALVEVDEEDLIGFGEGSHPRSFRVRFDVDSPAGYRERARAQKASKMRRTSMKKPRAFRATFDSAKAASKMFYDANETFFDHVADPWDGLRDWMDGIEVRSGKRSKRLSETPAGQRILGQRHASEAIRQALAYVFGRARARRWDAVGWREVERLEAALRPYFEPSASEPSEAGLTWKPVIGSATRLELEQLPPDQREQAVAWETAEELRLAIAELRDAYEKNRACLSPALRQVVERRLREWTRWSRDPRKIPEYACEPDPRTGGYTCNYPSVAGELRRLRDACQRAGYDPDWAKPLARAGTPGFPDTSMGPEDPAPWMDNAMAQRVSVGSTVAHRGEPGVVVERLVVDGRPRVRLRYADQTEQYVDLDKVKPMAQAKKKTSKKKSSKKKTTSARKKASSSKKTEPKKSAAKKVSPKARPTSTKKVSPKARSESAKKTSKKKTTRKKSASKATRPRLPTADAGSASAAGCNLAEGRWGRDYDCFPDYPVDEAGRRLANFRHHGMAFNPGPSPEAMYSAGYEAGLRAAERNAAPTVNPSRPKSRPKRSAPKRSTPKRSKPARMNPEPKASKAELDDIRRRMRKL